MFPVFRCIEFLSLSSRGCLAKFKRKGPSTAWPDVYPDIFFLRQGCRHWEQGEYRPHSQCHGGHAAPQTEVLLHFLWFFIMDTALLVVWCVWLCFIGVRTWLMSGDLRCCRWYSSSSVRKMLHRSELEIQMERLFEVGL